MEVTSLHNISLGQFKSFFPSAPSIGMGDDFYIMDIKFSERNKILGHPCRFDGYMLLYCIKGNLRLNVNLTEFQIGDGMIFMNVPGNIIRVNELVDVQQKDLHYICIALSREFVQGLHIDVNKMFNEGLSMLENPSLRLKEGETQLLCRQIDLIINVLKSDVLFKKECVYSMLSSMFYIIMGVWGDRQSNDRSLGQVTHTRSKVIFDQFIKLVSEYHTQYRNVGFYADKLCLTPKYLSKLIKGATGRSAPDWIDAYVILEAKNLLKYSNVTIKEVVYRLNFPNQSVFYKFFKARTGMTPTEYRNS